jgi:hypothetical protein
MSRATKKPECPFDSLRHDLHREAGRAAVGKSKPRTAVAADKDAIIEAINDLFGDTSRPASATLEMLEDIEASLAGNIDAIKADLKEGRST